MQQQRNIAGAETTPLLERPLSARSVMASLLLGMSPPRIRGALLVRWCGLFGIAEGTARVALHRMTTAGELTARQGVYELAGRLAQRQRQQEWSIHPRLRAWRDDWALATVTRARRGAADRQALRRAMAARRCAEVREGVWARPDNLPAESVPHEARMVADRQCTWWRARPTDDAGALAARLFAPRAWADRAGRLELRLTEITDTLALGDDGLVAESFLIGAAALRHIRADPLLPPELLSPGWPGDGLRAAYVEYRSAFARASRDWFRQAA